MQDLPLVCSGPQIGHVPGLQHVIWGRLNLPRRNNLPSVLCTNKACPFRVAEHHHLSDKSGTTPVCAKTSLNFLAFWCISVGNASS
jgi:hypothetical protein